MFDHITQQEYFAVLTGVFAVWALKFSKEKDESDEKKEQFDMTKWVKSWFYYRIDNVVAHLVVAFAALFIGVENLQAWMGDSLNFPQGVDEIGAAFIIGFMGSYLAEILKKAL